MELVRFLSGDDFVLFLLLFVRLSSLISFLPFFSHTSIPMTVKAALSFFLTILFFPLIAQQSVPAGSAALLLAILSEAAFGFFAGFVVNFAFAMLTAAGEQISMMMGFSMATAFDPASGQSSQIVSQFLSILMLLVLLALDGHHLMIRVMSSSLVQVPLGGFVMTHAMFDYSVYAMKHLFMTGFMMAFPIVALSLLADIIFGMMMKTMPTFNTLVVGFPIKIVVSMVVLMAILSSLAVFFFREFSTEISQLAGMLH